MTDIYIGIDPGQSGGLAAIVSGSAEAIPMPPTERDVWEWFCGWDSSRCVAVIEWIHPAIQGVGKSSMSKLYGNYAQLRGYLIASKIRFEDEKTAKWCRALGIPPRTKTETRTLWKNRLKGKAQELFPQTTLTLKTADALLIAEFCRRKWEGVL
jgi:hypothetical protein